MFRKSSTRSLMEAKWKCLLLTHLILISSSGFETRQKIISLLLTEMPRPNSILLCDCRLWLSSLLRRFLLLLPCEGLQIHLSVWSENVKSSASPPSMLRMPPVVAILALDSSVVEPILMHLSPSRATIMQPRPSSREMIMRARHAWTWAADRNKHNGLGNKTFYIKKGRY